MLTFANLWIAFVSSSTCNIYTSPPQCPGAGSEDSTHWMYLSGAAGGATDAATLISPESQPPTGDCFMFMFNLPVTVINDHES